MSNNLILKSDLKKKCMKGIKWWRTKTVWTFTIDAERKENQKINDKLFNFIFLS